LRRRRRDAEVGRKAVLVLRPEKILANPIGRSYQNGFTATVLDPIYSGDHIRCLLDIFGRQDWSAKFADHALGADIARGARLELGWDASDCLLFDPESGG
jgi:putative spermidine/putrescine transport system ATP-binding protein